MFRKWGRVGEPRIGGEKMETMSKQGAIEEFKRLFVEKTGNQWEAWVQRQNIQKRPGRYFPLDIVPLILYLQFCLPVDSSLLILTLYIICF